MLLGVPRDKPRGDIRGRLWARQVLVSSVRQRYAKADGRDVLGNRLCSRSGVNDGRVHDLVVGVEVGTRFGRSVGQRIPINPKVSQHGVGGSFALV